MTNEISRDDCLRLRVGSGKNLDEFLEYLGENHPGINITLLRLKDEGRNSAGVFDAFFYKDDGKRELETFDKEFVNEGGAYLINTTPQQLISFNTRDEVIGRKIGKTASLTAFKFLYDRLQSAREDSMMQ